MTDGHLTERRREILKAFREGYQSGRYGGRSRRRGLFFGLMWALNRTMETWS